MLGQDEEITESTNFKILNYDTDNIEFTEVKLGTNHALGITSNRELYCWGSNSNYQWGLPEAKNYFIPIEIPYFKDYFTYLITLGEDF